MCILSSRKSVRKACYKVIYNTAIFGDTKVSEKKKHRQELGPTCPLFIQKHYLIQSIFTLVLQSLWKHSWNACKIQVLVFAFVTKRHIHGTCLILPYHFLWTNIRAKPDILKILSERLVEHSAVYQLWIYTVLSVQTNSMTSETTIH